MTPPNAYKTASAFRAALEARLSQAASGTMTIERLRQQAAFDRFLARLFDNSEPEFLVKGGYAMELRLRHRARFSRDLDLTAKQEKILKDPIAIQTKLQNLLAKDLGDWFTFLLSEATLELEGAPDAGYRFPVEARLDNRTFAKFHVDIGIGDAVLDSPTWVPGNPLFDFAGIARAQIPLLPAETHFAEKIHAYTRTRRTGVNSRVRDLVDLILLLDAGFPDADALRGALNSTFTRRNTHPLPKILPEPHASWTNPYAEIAFEIGLTSAPSSADAYRRLSKFWIDIFPKGAQ